MSTNIIIPSSLVHRSRDIYKLIDRAGEAGDFDDEFGGDESVRIVSPEEAGGLLVGAKSFDPTLPFGGRLRGKAGKGLRVGDSSYPTVDDYNGCGRPPVIDPCVFRGGQRLCDMQKVAWSIVIAGGEYRELIIQPRKASYMDPKGIRARMTALADTSLEFDALVTKVAINDIPQEGINVTGVQAAAVAGDTLQGFWLSDWRYPTRHAVPVSWGWFSNEANSNPLSIGTFALGISANILLLATYNVYGNLLTQAPEGRDAGQRPQGG